MARNHRAVGRFLLFFCVCTLLFPQRSVCGDQSTSAPAVSIPVTVMNKNGDFVSGLESASFLLSEGGHNRPIESVQEIGPLLVGSMKVKVPFVVVDAYSSESQGELRDQCLRMLAHSAAGELPVSLSQVDRDGLHEVHGPQTPSSVLASALLRLDNERHFLTDSDRLQAIQNGAHKSLVAAEAERLERFRRGSVEVNNMMGAVLSQLEALQQIAIALQHVTGRKTVILLTGYFPLDVNEAEDSLNINGFGIRSGFAVQSASIDYQKTLNLLNDAQISLFPVQIGPRSQAAVNGGSTAVSRNNLIFPSPLPHEDDLTEIGLRRIARSTGGELLPLADNLEGVVQRAEHESTNYYLLRFQPEQIKGGLRWRGLNLKLRDKSLKPKSPDGLFLLNTK